MKSISLVFNGTNSVTTARSIFDSRAQNYYVQADVGFNHYTSSYRTKNMLKDAEQYCAKHSIDYDIVYMFSDEFDNEKSLLVMVDNVNGWYMSPHGIYKAKARCFVREENTVVFDIEDETTVINRRILAAARARTVPTNPINFSEEVK